MPDPKFYPAPGILVVRYSEASKTASGIHLVSSLTKSIVEAEVVGAGYPPVAQDGSRLEGYDFKVGHVILTKKTLLIPAERPDNKDLYLLRHNDVLGSFEPQEV